MKVFFQIKAHGKTLDFDFHMDTLPLQIESIESMASLMRAILVNTEIDAAVDSDDKAMLDETLKAKLHELKEMKRAVWKRQRSQKGINTIRLLPIEGSPRMGGNSTRIVPIKDSPHIVHENSESVHPFKQRLRDALDSAKNSHEPDVEDNITGNAVSGGTGNRPLVSKGPGAFAGDIASTSVAGEHKSNGKWNLSSFSRLFLVHRTKVAPQNSMTNSMTADSKKPFPSLSSMQCFSISPSVPVHGEELKV